MIGQCDECFNKDLEVYVRYSKDTFNLFQCYAYHMDGHVPQAKTVYTTQGFICAKCLTGK